MQGAEIRQPGVPVRTRQSEGVHPAILVGQSIPSIGCRGHTDDRGVRKPAGAPIEDRVTESKMPPSLATSQYPLPSGVDAIPTMGRFRWVPPIEPSKSSPTKASSRKASPTKASSQKKSPAQRATPRRKAP